MYELVAFLTAAILIAWFGMRWLLPTPDGPEDGPAKSTHRVEVIKVEAILKHPNADRLEIIPIFGGGYQCVVQKGQFVAGQLAAYVPPDSLVPLDREEFAFLKASGRTPKIIEGREYHRVTSIKLRMAPSTGLLIHPPLFPSTTFYREGEDIAKSLEVLHYEPPISGERQNRRQKGRHLARKPKTPCPYYDLDSLRRYSNAFEEGEPVVVTEKIHGMNAAYLWEPLPSIHWGYSRWDKQFFLRLGLVEGRLSWNRWPLFRLHYLPWEAVNVRVRSQTVWRLYDREDPFWKALTQEMIHLIMSIPKHTLFGEVYGPEAQAGFSYGLPEGEVRFAAFDIYDGRALSYMNQKQFRFMCRIFNVPTVPYLSEEVPFSLSKVLEMAEGSTTLWHNSSQKPHVREGVVVRPPLERNSPLCGRVVLKAVGLGYLEKDDQGGFGRAA